MPFGIALLISWAMEIMCAFGRILRLARFLWLYFSKRYMQDQLEQISLLLHYGVGRKGAGPLNFLVLLTYSKSVQVDAFLHTIDSRSIDGPIWKLTIHVSFIVNSYKFINQGGLFWPYYKKIWKAEVPEKIRVFMWPALKNRFNIGEVLVKKG